MTLALVPSERPRVLLVDDEPRVLEALAPFLLRTYDVDTCSSAVAALARVREQTYLAVVSDLRMPTMDGVELLKHVRSISPVTARILLTGQGEIDDAVHAINDAAVHRYLAKPCSSIAVLEAIREAVSANNGLDGAVLAELGRKAALGSLAGSIGHEIGNAVAALDGTLEAVREDVAAGRPVTEEDLSLIELVKIRLADQAAELRTLSRPRALAVDDVDLVAIVLQTVRVMQRFGVLRGTNVTTALPAKPVLVRADVRALEGALINLIKNAGEATNEKRADAVAMGLVPEAGIIRISVEEKDRFALLGVEDDGCGIPRDRLARIFEPHRSTKGEAGSGLGLGIVRTSIERQGGSVAVTSTVDVGTRIEISLPRAR